MDEHTSTTSLVKTPYIKTHFRNQTELNDFKKCCNQTNGYKYFLDNFFMIQHPTKGAITYHPYGYQQRLADVYHGYVHSVNLLPRQSGKCVNQHTKINIRNDKTGKTYDIPIGIYFEFIKSMQLGIAGPDVSAFEVQSM